jgi:hypothetical protein
MAVPVLGGLQTALAGRRTQWKKKAGRTVQIELELDVVHDWQPRAKSCLGETLISQIRVLTCMNSSISSFGRTINLGSYWP